MGNDRPRLLAVVSRFKWIHINYLKALEAHFEVRVAWSGEGGKGAARDGLSEGLHGAPIGTIREDGRKMHPAYLYEVKRPEESRYQHDYYKLLQTVSAEEAFRPLSEGGCPLVRS